MPAPAATARGRAAASATAAWLEVDEVLREFLHQCLDVQWSLEQVNHAPTVEFPDDPTRQLVTESLYRALADVRSNIPTCRTGDDPGPASSATRRAATTT